MGKESFSSLVCESLAGLIGDSPTSIKLQVIELLPG
jgi:hypothetical protein